ncbi:AraC family transcriptional regulator [Chryseobacterium sp. PBS4-4]|uniref:AraC family transcriptional regulator n=1 Tax=Chryseobacterium edaphi TaxID=2976532 RepID=A0ABT2W6J4_9FLAO|nr:AraC family transcriptional regulator [Chryseobacterium edaphi]MCU7616892.1 AraC family transcriptional regulator [Chryseobacterium edaphi]
MYQITNQLHKIGFSISLISSIIKRNNYQRQFNTQEFFCILLTAQDLDIVVSNRAYRISGGNAVFIGPQKDVEIDNAFGKEIYVIAFSAGFYDKSSKDSLFLNSQVFFNSQSEIFIAPYFGNNKYNQIILVERLLKFQSKDESLYISAAHNAIEGLILDAYLHVENHHVEKDERMEYVSYVNRFRILLQRDFKIAKKVSHYAEELKISVRRLTEMTEYVYGKSAKQLIIEKVKIECEKAIKFSNFTMSEIAFDLGFNDEGNFSNFVKKHTGKKPSEMREISA